MLCQREKLLKFSVRKISRRKEGRTWRGRVGRREYMGGTGRQCI